VGLKTSTQNCNLARSLLRAFDISHNSNLLNTTMIPETTNPENQESLDESIIEISPIPAKPPGSYVKHAMRNMVRKRGKSLQHFFLSTVGLLILFVGLAYLTR
jgi:Protein of unknown function (DUF3285)